MSKLKLSSTTTISNKPDIVIDDDPDTATKLTQKKNQIAFTIKKLEIQIKKKENRRKENKLKQALQKEKAKQKERIVQSFFLKS
jgi:hypothetical protein